MTSHFMLSSTNRPIASATATATATSPTKSAFNNIIHVSGMPVPGPYDPQQTKTKVHANYTSTHHPNTAQQPQPQPPQLKYDCHSHSSSSASSSLTSPPPIGLVNYSPKHSRKPSSLSSNRNMKNLSLNLHSSNSSASSSSSFISSPSITKHGPILTAGPLTKLSLSIPDYPRPDGTSAVTLRPFHDDITTPLVTQTPTMPPALNPQVHTNTPAEYRFPPSSPSQIDQRRHSGPNKRHSNCSSSQSLDMNVFMANRNDSFDHSTVQPPPAPPFAPGMKGSPLSTPPRLTSPLKLHGISPETPRSLTDALARVSMTTNEDYNDSMLSNTPQSLFTTYKEIIPEELQESNSLDAYPNGPRSVLNNRIFLYSDPLTSKKQLDINEYNLVINVAKECKDMSASYLNPIPGKREYLYLPWLHTSQISKDLAPIMTKIDAFYNMGYKILIHCQCGVSRSACVVVAYYMMKFTLGVNDAYELLKNGTNGNREVCMRVRNGGDIIDGSDRICPNMSLIFELMEFGDSLCHKEVTTSALLFDSPSTMQI